MTWGPGMRCAWVAVLPVCLGGCVLGVNWQRAEADFGGLTLPFDGITGLVIDWSGGGVSVTFDETATEISAAGTKFVRASTVDLAYDGLDDIAISLEDDGAGTATLRFSAPRRANPIYSGNVAVVVPGGLVLSIRGETGGIVVTGNVGTTTVEHDSGMVVIREQQGDTSVVLTTGDVVVESTDGDVSVALVTGDIQASAAGNVAVETVTGDLDVLVRPAEGGSVMLGSTTGNVKLQVPGEFAAALTLAIELGGNIIAPLEGFAVESLEVAPRRVTAVLNGGGGKIECTTATGDIEFAALAESTGG